MSSGRAPEYTMLTPVPLTPELHSHGFEPYAGSGLGLALPCEMIFHYSMGNLLPAPSPADDSNGSDYGRPAAAGEDEDGDFEEEEEGEPKGDGLDPFSPHCKIPLPSPFSPCAYWLEPSFIRRRNERERQRVRNVNDGFERLKNHLPITSKDKDKRLSKVEILRMAIRYIQSLQDLLKRDADDSKENVASRSRTGSLSDE